MLLTFRTTHVPATDLGFLLHKHPGKVQAFELPFGKVHVFYPEVSEEACTVALLLLDVDPVGLVRGRQGPADHRFEWTRAELRTWAGGVAGRFGYRVRYLPVGEEDPELGPPTQMAVFERGEGAES